MQTNFFSMLAELAPNLDWNIRITKTEDNQLKVFILPFNHNVKDPAKHIIQPLIFTESAEKLNNDFFAAIKEPMHQVAKQFGNMESHAKSMEESRKKSQMEKEAREKEEKEKKEKKNKYEAQMKKVADLEKVEKWGEAIGAMPSAEEYALWADEINKKMEELRSKSTALSLF